MKPSRSIVSALALSAAFTSASCKKPLPNITGQFAVSSITNMTRFGNAGGTLVVTLSDEQRDSTAIRIMFQRGYPDVLCEGRAQRADGENKVAHFRVAPMACRYVNSADLQPAYAHCPQPSIDAVAFKHEGLTSPNALRVYAGSVRVMVPPEPPNTVCPSIVALEVPTDAELVRRTTPQ